MTEPYSLNTDYGYDPLGNLTSVVQHGTSSETARQRNFVYDSLSRLTSATNPETGQVSYNYYDNGILHQKTDARGVWTAYAYDALNRLTDKYFNDGLTPNQHFRYDQTSSWAGTQYNTIGRLSEAYTDQDRRYYGSGSPPACNPQSSSTANYNPAYGNPTYCEWTDELYSYDSTGRVNRIPAAFPSEGGWSAHETDIGYDLAGNVTSLRYPDGRAVTQGWDAGGRMTSSVFDNWNGQHVGYTYASGFTYTPAGAQTEMTMGNGVYTHVPYNNRQQICQVWIQNPQQTLMDKHYFYTAGSGYCANNAGNNGNIAQIQDMQNNNRSQSFSYDALNRLSSFSNGDDSMQQSYTMDSFGNMSQSGTLNFQGNYTASGDNRINLNGYGYDLAGNLTNVNNGLPSTYSFDAESKIFNVNTGGAYYTYDAAGERMRKDTAGSFTEYQYLQGQPIAEKNSDGTWSDYIYANGQRIARADSFDARIHVHGTTPGGATASWLISGGGYIIKPNDRLFLRQYQYMGFGGTEYPVYRWNSDLPDVS